MQAEQPLANQCTAFSKRSGERCKNWAVTGRTVCRMHGGKTPRGIASPQYKGRDWSKDMPARLASRYLESANDPDLLSLKQEVRLIDVLLQDDLTRLESGESAETWNVMRDAVDKLEAGIAADLYLKVFEALREMRDIVDRRILHYATVEEIRQKVDQRRKLVEAETKMLYRQNRAITVDQAMLLVGALAGILRSRISDAGILSAIQNDVNRLLADKAVG